MFDVAWSESHPDHVLLACGDGSCLLFDLAAPANVSLRGTGVMMTDIADETRMGGSSLYDRRLFGGNTRRRFSG